MRHRSVSRIPASGENMWGLIRDSYERLSRHDVDVDAAYEDFERCADKRAINEPSHRPESQRGHRKIRIAPHRRIAAIGAVALTVVIVIICMLVIGAFGLTGAPRSWAASSPNDQMSTASATTIPDRAKPHKTPEKNRASGLSARRTGDFPALAQQSASWPTHRTDGLSAGFQLGHTISLTVALDSSADGKSNRLQAVVRIAVGPQLSGTCSLTLLSGSVPKSWLRPSGARDSHIIKIASGKSSVTDIRIDPIATLASGIGCAVVSPAGQPSTAPDSVSLPGQVVATASGAIASINSALGLGIPSR
jgi:hypothetical protein